MGPCIAEISWGIVHKQILAGHVVNSLFVHVPLLLAFSGKHMYHSAVYDIKCYSLFYMA
jgi:hypothetical protein